MSRSALSLGLKMLLRGRGPSLSILAMALLVAILASATSVVNYIDHHAQALAELASPGRTYLIMSDGSTSTAGGESLAELASRLRALGHFDHVLLQRAVRASAATGLGTEVVWVRGVDDVRGFLKSRGARLEGSIARGRAEVNAGELLANALSVGVGDELLLAVGAEQVEVRVVGVFRSQAQSDVELLAPLEVVDALVGGDGAAPLIELVLKRGVDRAKAVSEVARLLPEGFELVQVERVRELALAMSSEVLAFLTAWSSVVYVSIAVASYVIASRLVAESSYELAVLRALGARGSTVLALVMTYVIVAALTSSLLGIAMGTACSQAVSTVLRWVRPSVEVAPFLKAEQALQILLLALASSTLGCAPPSLRAARTRHVGRQL